MKTLTKLILQRLFGFERYLYFFSRFIIRKLKWDKNERDFLHFLSMLPPAGAVLDIGANIGVMSYYLASGSAQRQVYAFEPIPYNFKNLEKVKQHFKLDNLQTYQLALGTETGELEMVLPVQNAVRFHGLAHVKHESIKELNQGEVFKCPVEKLDSFTPLREDDIQIAGIKIDVENFEYFVLKGAEELLKKHKPVIYSELWDNTNRRKTMDFLENLGYKTLVLQKGTLQEFNQGVHITQNFFFINF